MTVVVTHTTPADSTFSSTGAAAWNADHTLAGVGTMAEQNANNVAITGGTINGTTVGATTPATGVFTTLTATGSGAFGTTVSASNRLVVKGGASAQCFRVEGSSGGFTNIDMVGDRTSGNLGGFRAYYTTDANEFFGIYPQASKSNTLFNLGNGSNAPTTQFSLSHTASAVNYIQATGAATGGRPTISAQGSDNPISFDINAKGSAGVINFGNGGTYPYFKVQGVSGQTVVNYVTATGTQTGIAPSFVSTGTDTNISQVFQSKGTGAIDLAAGSSGVNISNGGTVTALTRTAAGSGYTSSPSNVISAPTTAGGVQAVGTTVIQNTSATVASGGTGYVVGDTVTMAGGTLQTGSAGTFRVATVSAGAITSLDTPNFAQYSVAPTNPVTVTGGSGSGATLNVTYIFGYVAITNAGSGYVEQPTVSFSGGGGSGAAAYATVGSPTVIRGLGPAMDFYTPAGTGFRVGDAGATSTYYWQAIGGAFNGILRGGGSTQNALIQTGGTGGVSLQTNNGAQTQMLVAHAASAVNYVQVTGAATGNAVSFSAQGSDSNIWFNYSTKGVGTHQFLTNNSAQVQFTVSHTASAVNYVQVTGAATGGSPTISAQGSDANSSINLVPKGTGNAGSGAGIILLGSDALTQLRTAAVSAASGNTFLEVQRANGFVNLKAITGASNGDIALTPQGTGNVRFGTHTGTADTAVSGYIEIKDSGGTIRKLAVIT